MNPVIQQIPSDLARPIKDLKLGNNELIKVTNELNTKSQKQIEELQKLNLEVAKLDPVVPVLPFFHQQFFVYNTTTNGAVLGPYNLEKYSTLTGYLQLSAYNLICRVDYLDSENHFIGLDEWVISPESASKGCYSSFHLPILGPLVRLRFQGQYEGNATLTLQADQTKGLPKWAASLSPLIRAEASIAASSAADFNILDIVGGPINYSISSLAGQNCAFVIYGILPPLPLSEPVLEQINLVAANGFTTQGVINLPPWPIRIRLYNQGSTTQTVLAILWQ